MLKIHQEMLELLTQPVDRFLYAKLFQQYKDQRNSSFNKEPFFILTISTMLRKNSFKKNLCLSYTFFLINSKKYDLLYLIIHNNFISHCIQQSCLCNKIFLIVLILFLPSLLYIVSRQCIQASHLVFFMVSIVQIAIYTCCFQQLYKLFCFSLLVVFQL